MVRQRLVCCGQCPAGVGTGSSEAAAGIGESMRPTPWYAVETGSWRANSSGGSESVADDSTCRWESTGLFSFVRAYHAMTARMPNWAIRLPSSNQLSWRKSDRSPIKRPPKAKLSIVAGQNKLVGRPKSVQVFYLPTGADCRSRVEIGCPLKPPSVLLLSKRCHNWPTDRLMGVASAWHPVLTTRANEAFAARACEHAGGDLNECCESQPGQSNPVSSPGKRPNSLTPSPSLSFRSKGARFTQARAESYWGDCADGGCAVGDGGGGASVKWPLTMGLRSSPSQSS